MENPFGGMSEHPMRVLGVHKGPSPLLAQGSGATGTITLSIVTEKFQRVILAPVTPLTILNIDFMQL